MINKNIIFSQNVIKKEGNTYIFEENKLGVSREKAINTLKADKEIYEKIRKIVGEIIKTNKI